MLRESMAFCTSLTRTPREALPDMVIRQRAKSRKPPADKRGRGALIRLLDRYSEALVVHDPALLPSRPERSSPKTVSNSPWEKGSGVLAALRSAVCLQLWSST